MPREPHQTDDAAISARPGGRGGFRRGRAVVLSAILAGAAVLLYVGQLRYPADPASGRGINDLTLAQQPGDSTSRAFHVATFNIHSGVGRDGQRDLTRTAGNLADADFIGLNEVQGSLPWRSGNQARTLGESLRRGWLFAPTERRWWCEHFGNGILSRVPVGAWERVPLAGTQSKGHRNMLVAEATVEGRPVRIIVTHIARGVNRNAQLTQVLRAFLDLPPPCVLMGDFNTRADEEPLKNLLHQPSVIDAVGQSKAGAGRIDWILVRGLTVLNAGLRDNGASDHPCAWAELQLRLVETGLSRP